MLKPKDPNLLGLTLENKAVSAFIEVSAVNSSVDSRQDKQEIYGGNSSRNQSVLDALKLNLLKECSESPLGTCLIAELGRFIEILDLYRPIADFPIEQIFKYCKREVGMPNSIIQQAIRKEAEAALSREPATAMP